MIKTFFLSLFFVMGLLSTTVEGASSLKEEGASTSIDQKLSEYIHYDSKGPNQVGYLSIGKDRAIDQSTFIYIKFALDHFKKLKVPFVVLELNTPGGEVFAALKICDLLKQLDTNSHIPVVAFVDNWAISAGAMLAYSCRFIGITKSSSMGAAEPVIAGKEGQMESASEKINSALRSEFSNLASFYGKDPLLAEAMVDKDILLVYRDGHIVKLDDEKEIRTKDGKENPDIIITKKGKLLTLNSEQLLQYGVADFIVPPEAVAPITDQEKSQGIWPASKNLLFQEPFFAKIPQATLVAYHDWRVDFFSFLTHPLVSSLLVMGLIIGIYMELNHPGFGVPGILGAICLALILLSSFAVQAASWLEVILLVSGIILLLIEFFVMPSFGVLGVVGILLTFGGLFALMIPHFGSADFNIDLSHLNLVALAVLNRLAWLCGALILSVIAILILARYFSYNFRLFDRLVLKGEQEGYIAGMEASSLPKLGTKGIAFTTLRPAGKVQIDDRLFDAITKGGFIERGTPIVVAKLEGSKIIVQESESE